MALSTKSKPEVVTSCSRSEVHPSPPRRLNDETAAEIIEGARLGAEWAWRAIALHYVPSLEAFATSRNVEDPAGIASISLLELARSIDSFRGNNKRSLDAYIYRTARNRMTDEFRKKSPETVSLPPELAFVDDAASRIEHNAVAKDWVTGALSTLSEDQRKVVELRILEDRSVAETAVLLNKKPGTIHTLQHRAIQALRIAMATAAVIFAVLGIRWATQEPAGIIDSTPATESELPLAELQQVDELGEGEGSQQRESSTNPKPSETESDTYVATPIGPEEQAPPTESVTAESSDADSSEIGQTNPSASPVVGPADSDSADSDSADSGVTGNGIADSDGADSDGVDASAANNGAETVVAPPGDITATTTTLRQTSVPDSTTAVTPTTTQATVSTTSPVTSAPQTTVKTTSTTVTTVTRPVTTTSIQDKPVVPVPTGCEVQLAGVRTQGVEVHEPTEVFASSYALKGSAGQTIAIVSNPQQIEPGEIEFESIPNGFDITKIYSVAAIEDGVISDARLCTRINRSTSGALTN